MTDLSYVMRQILFALPTLATLAVGVILLVARRHRLAPNARGYGLAGCLVMFASVLANAAFLAWLPRLAEDWSYSEISQMVNLSGMVFMALNCTGFALFIAAILAGGARSATPQPPARYPPYGAAQSQAYDPAQGPGNDPWSGQR